VARQYLWALDRALQTLLAEPEKCADITLKALPPDTLTREQILRRFELQKAYIQPKPNARLLDIKAGKLEDVLAALLQMGKVEL
jgi:hypothetical protein